MTPERFAYLADAYGADLHRWPGAEQGAAQALLDSGDVLAREAQQQARWLDGQLDSHQLAYVEPALARQIRLSPRVAIHSGRAMPVGCRPPAWWAWASRASLPGCWWHP